MESKNTGPIRIVIIQTSVMGDMEALMYFDRFSIEGDQDYALFNLYNEEVEIVVVPNFPQLFFTSHLVGHDSRKIAASIKSKNSEAIVFALTNLEVSSENTQLDGVIHKSTMPSGFAARVARAFLDGQTREQLVAMVKQIGG